jgi:hypothetical protein
MRAALARAPHGRVGGTPLTSPCRECPLCRLSSTFALSDTRRSPVALTPARKKSDTVEEIELAESHLTPGLFR